MKSVFRSIAFGMAVIVLCTASSCEDEEMGHIHAKDMVIKEKISNKCGYYIGVPNSFVNDPGILYVKVPKHTWDDWNVGDPVFPGSIEENVDTDTERKE